MSLELILSLEKFNCDLQRFADIHGDCIETEDIQRLSKEFNGICRVRDLKAINTEPTPDEAFEFLDILAGETEDKPKREAPQLSPITWAVFDILCWGLYSKANDWFDDWETLEGDIINFLPNEEVKNWKPLSPDSEDETNFKFVMSALASRFLALLWKDLKGQKITLIEKIGIIQSWRDEFEPNIDDSEGFGKEHRFQELTTSKTWGELFENLADWVNELVYVDWDENGNEVYGETVAEDYLNHICPLVARIELLTWRN